MSQGKRTLVEEGTELKGTMVSKCPIVVMGKVEGDISGPSIEIAESGIVAGNVNVKELRSAGEVAGHVSADAVYLSGRVRDNTVIRAATLEVNLTRTEGPMEVVFGVCELAIGDEPTRHAKDAKSEAKAPAPVVTIPPLDAADGANGEDKSGKGRPARRTQPPPSP
jgi:cytoskeletal protein CcmA (bactofilin family)